MPNSGMNLLIKNDRLHLAGRVGMVGTSTVLPVRSVTVGTHQYQYIPKYCSYCNTVYWYRYCTIICTIVSI